MKLNVSDEETYHLIINNYEYRLFQNPITVLLHIPKLLREN